MTKKDGFKSLLEETKGVNQLKEELKNSEIQIQERLADILNYVKEDTGEPDIKAIKKPILKQVIVNIDSGKNKIEEDLEIFELYREKVKDDSELNILIQDYILKQNSIKVKNSDVNSVKKEIKKSLDQDDVNKIFALVKDIIKAEKEELTIEEKIHKTEEVIEYIKEAVKEIMT